MRCIRCNTRVGDLKDGHFLKRTAPKGVTPANWTCTECLGEKPKTPVALLNAIEQEESK